MYTVCRNAFVYDFSDISFLCLCICVCLCMCICMNDTEVQGHPSQCWQLMSSTQDSVDDISWPRVGEGQQRDGNVSSSNCEKHYTLCMYVCFCVYTIKKKEKEKKKRKTDWWLYCLAFCPNVQWLVHSVLLNAGYYHKAQSYMLYIFFSFLREICSSSCKRPLCQSRLS